ELGQKSVADYKDLIKPNTFPHQMRGTLRDVISYKALEALENSSNWQASETNSLYKLPLEEVLAGDLKALGLESTVSLTDNRHHPVLRLGYIAADLAQWNRTKGNHDGALEANIALHKALHNIFQHEDEKKTIRQNLLALLNKHRHIAWASSGFGHLASMHQV